MINNSILFLFTFDINVLFTINLVQVKHFLFMHFENVKLANWSVTLATKTYLRGLPFLAAL